MSGRRGLNSLLHYIHYGAAEGRHPHARAAASWPS